MASCLTLSPKKSFLGFSEITLLGFTVDRKGAKITDERTKAIAQLKMPTTLGELETYIGGALV